MTKKNLSRREVLQGLGSTIVASRVMPAVFDMRLLAHEFPQPTGSAAPMHGRYVTLSTIVRKYQVETTPGDYSKQYEDETSLHDAAAIREFAETIRRSIPNARITWAFSWLALTDESPRYLEIRAVVKNYHHQFGDDVSYCPGGYSAPRWSRREEINKELANAFGHMDRWMGGYRPGSIVAGNLPVECIRFARRTLGVKVVQGQEWSQYNAGNADSDGSICYPYYPSSEHFLKPAQGDSDFVDCINLDGWTVDFVAGHYPGGKQKNGIHINSRLGLGPIETLHNYGREIGLAELKATSSTHLSEENLNRNPFAWITTNYEISEVVRGRKRRAGLPEFGEWLAWLRATWPDLQCLTLTEFGARVRANYPNNERLKYIFRQQGSGIGGSFKGEEVTWFMNQAFRLAVFREQGATYVIDYTDYRPTYSEPKKVGEQNWSLWGEINQKALRPQDQPLTIAEFVRSHPDVIVELHRRYPGAAEVKEFFG
jgi:hypothetical protein